MLKDSDDLNISTAASERLGTLRKFCRVLHDRLLLVLDYCFGVLFLAPLTSRSSSLRCAAEHLAPLHTLTKLLDRLVSGASFLTGGVFKSDIAHRRSVAVLSMMYKIRCNPMRPHYGALPLPLCQCGFFGCTAVYIYAPPRCRTSQHRKTFIPLSVSLWNDLADPVFDCVGLYRFLELGQYLFIDTFCFLVFFLSPLSFYIFGITGLGSLS